MVLCEADPRQLGIYSLSLMSELRSLRQRQCIHVFVSRITQRAHLEVPYFRL